VSKQVDDMATLVGTEKFFLKVGELLHSKGAEIGLRPDGIISMSGEEKIEAGKFLSERVEEIHHRSESVINPAIGEIVALMGQIDEFKRIRMRVKEAAIAQNLKPSDVDTVDMEVEKFLNQPQVRDSLEKLAVAEQRLEAAVYAFNELEEEDVTGVEELSLPEETDLIPPSFVASSVNVSTAGASQIPPAEVAANAQSNLSPEQIQSKLSFWENTLLKHAEFKAREREYIAAAGTAVVNGVANAEKSIAKAVGKGVDSV
jgi:hypothetical protein